MAALSRASEIEHVTTLLADLGMDADTVAASLLRHGAVGVRYTVRFLNPVIRFVIDGIRPAAEYFDGEELYVPSADVSSRRTLRITHQDGGVEEAPLPAAVRDFLDAFDAGAYPDLELPTEIF
ncbi:MAG: hypothetical protein U0793_30535 [Gemmataceae bacterium]